MAKRGRKKQPKTGVEIQVIVLIVLSILAFVLIYTSSGVIGQTISPFLGGIFGFMKNIIPWGIFLIAIYVACNPNDKLTPKIAEFVVLLLCIAIVLGVYQISVGNVVSDGKNMSQIWEQGYNLGTRGIGGGAIGTCIGKFLMGLVGGVGANLIAIGLSVVMLVLMFAIHPSKMISGTIEKAQKKREEEKELREAALKAERREKLKQEKKRASEDAKLKIQEQEAIAAGIAMGLAQGGKPVTSVLSDFEGGIGESSKTFEKPPTKRELKRLQKEEEERKAKEEAENLKLDLDGLDKLTEQDEIDAIKEKNKNVFEKKEEKEPEVEPTPEVLGDIFAKEPETKREPLPVEENEITTQEPDNNNYEYPPIEFLSLGTPGGVKASKKAVADAATKIQKTLYSFGVSAKVENVSVGPTITRYELKPAEGVRVSKIARLADDIALNLAAKSIRIEAPIPGKQAVGIEVPNEVTETVRLRDILQSEAFQKSKSKLSFALGKDVAGEPYVTDIAKMPHVLIAGQTGSGKSVCINSLITSIIYKSKPNEVKFLMIDPKMVEFAGYNGIPHLLIPVVTDPKKAASALAWAVEEMENRYTLFAKTGVKDLASYNEEQDRKGGMKFPQIVIIIDELADLMMEAAKDVETSICRIAQKARACGMHLVIGTQRPSVNVITGVIKANIPSRIAFAVASQVDSKTILDMGGAEKLLGKGDMLFYPSGFPKPVRMQSSFVDDSEIKKMVNFLKQSGEANYNPDIIDKINHRDEAEEPKGEDEFDNEVDEYLVDAIDLAVKSGSISTVGIQRSFKVGYARAGRIIDQMAERGYISGPQGSKPRKVLITKERWEELSTSSDPLAGNTDMPEE